MLEQRGWLLEALSPSPGERVLDLGCGTGGLSLAAARHVVPGGRVVGVDASAEALELARQAEDVPAGVSFEVADGAALPFRDDIFDAAACINMLSWVADPEAVLAELLRVVRPDGRLLIANADEDQRIWNCADRCVDPWAGRRLGGLLTGAGFQVRHESVRTDIERTFVPGDAGYTVAHAMRDRVTELGGIAADDYDRWLTDLAERSLDGSYCYSVSTWAYVAVSREPALAGSAEPPDNEGVTDARRTPDDRTLHRRAHRAGPGHRALLLRAGSHLGVSRPRLGRPECRDRGDRRPPVPLVHRSRGVRDRRIRPGRPR